MKNKFVKKSIMALSMAMVLANTGCGTDGNNGVETGNDVPAESVMADVSTEQTVEETESEEAESEETDIEETEAEASETEETGAEETESEASETEETGAKETEAEESETEETGAEELEAQDLETVVLEIAEDGFKAMQELDAAQMMEYTNIDMFYYFANGEYAEGQQLKDKLEVILSDTDLANGYNNLGVIGSYASMQNVEFYDPQPLTEQEVQELVDFINSEEASVLGKTGEFEYIFEKAYKIKISYDGVVEENVESGNEPYVLVIYDKDEWKLDVLVYVMKESYDAMMSMFSQTSMQ